jgi:uncharacterized cupredoxin-like copper-binding protein
MDEVAWIIGIITKTWSTISNKRSKSMQSKHFPRITLLVLLAAGLLLAACGGGAGRRDTATVNTPQPSGANAGDATAGGAVINVTLTEMTVALDKTQAAAGTITFVVQNTGHAAHDFAIKGSGVDQKTPRLESGRSATLTVTLSPGTYEYECTVPGHAMAGMQGTLTVT